jgi:Mor family transcriptional regulator
MQPCSLFPRRKEYIAHTTALMDRQVKDAILRGPDGKLTDWARQTMIRQRREGQTIRDLMRRFGATESMVRRIVGKREKKAPLLAELIDASIVRKMIDQEMTWREIGDYFGVSESTVRKIVRGRRTRKSDKPLPHESWKPVIGFDGLYEVSSAGRVRSLDRQFLMTHRNGRVQVMNHYGRVLSQFKARYKGKDYRHVVLHRDGRGYQRKVHLLVCEAFHGPAPEDRPYVIFSDDDSCNAAANNLGWSPHWWSKHNKRAVLL